MAKNWIVESYTLYCTGEGFADWWPKDCDGSLSLHLLPSWKLDTKCYEVLEAFRVPNSSLDEVKLKGGGLKLGEPHVRIFVFSRNFAVCVCVWRRGGGETLC